MKKIYFVLLLITVILLGYTGYYVVSTKKISSPSPVVATTTEATTTTIEVVQSPDTKKTFITKTGKLITLQETNPTEQNLSTITITPEGFATNTPLVLEKNKLTNSLFADINKDTHEELILITTTQDPSKYSEATLDRKSVV